MGDLEREKEAKAAESQSSENKPAETSSAPPVEEKKEEGDGPKESLEEKEEEAEEGKEGDNSGESDEKQEKKEKKGGGKFQENPDSIPSAGGERLGEKHWGESKMVADVPQKRESEGGAGNVASADGQPDSMLTPCRRCLRRSGVGR